MFNFTGFCALKVTMETCSANDTILFNRWQIYWHTLEEWADLVYSWVQRCGMVNTVCTLYEITDGDNSADEGLLPVDRFTLFHLRLLDLLLFTYF